MKVTPILTEKSLNEAKKGHYSFVVENGADKGEIRKEIEKLFGVHIVDVRTINLKGGQKKNLRGRVKTIKDTKKALVSLKSGEKIDAFEEKTK